MSRRAKGLAAVAVTALAAGAAGGWALNSQAGGPKAEAASTDETGPTTTVTKTDLVETQDVDGTLGYGDQSKLGSPKQGTVTWLPKTGATVTRGKPLARIDQDPVTLLYGSVPMYRTLKDGDEGADVKQLEVNLAKLGYTGFTVDDEFTDNTAEAVEEWQDDLGIDETGTVSPAQVVFLPTAIRVADHDTEVGAKTGAALLTYTSTTRTVTVKLKVSDQRLAKKGAKVTVELPSGDTAKGTITEVGTVAELPAAQGNEQPDSADATIDVTVTMADPKAGGSLDEAPVTVKLVSDQRKGVLAVPVSALLALKEGGYGVQVVADGNSKVVPVKLGMFANGRVEISGKGITAGTKVGVPQV